MIVEINTLIARYIADNTRLIIPNIGTLLRRKESGEIVFMEMLKKGDGAFNSLVGTHFNLTEAEAVDAVEKYAAAIKRSLENNKKFIIDGVGVLLAGTNGGMEFIFNPSAHTIDAMIEEPKDIVEEPVVVAIEEEQVVEVIPDEDSHAAEESVVVEKPEDVVAPQPKADKVSALYGEEEDVEEKEFNIGNITNKLRAITKTSKSTSKPTGKSKKIKLDGITILAIVSALIAIATLVWGMIPNRTPLDIDAPIEIVEE